VIPKTGRCWHAPFTLWYDLPHRATRDADLLGFGPSDTASMAEVFRDIASIAGEDGIVFDPTSVRVVEIRKEAGYGGVRVTLNGQLAGARCVAQVDVGFGDAVTPGPTNSIYPVLLDDLPAPHLRTYTVYTVIAEKLHAVVVLGMVNSRLKDWWYRSFARSCGLPSGRPGLCGSRRDERIPILRVRSH
jgi:hypothetical protein